MSISNPVAEKALLGSVLINPSIFPELKHIAEPDFTYDRHKLIWRAMHDIIRAGNQIDFVTLSSRLDEIGGTLDGGYGGPAYLIQLANEVPTSMNASSYASLIEDASIRRAALDMASRVAAIANDDRMDAATLLTQVKSALSDTLENRYLSVSAASRPGPDSIADFIAHMNQPDGMSMQVFMPGIDAATGGIERKTLTVIASRPSMGKSALTWQMARNLALAGRRVIFFTLEESYINLWARAACGLVGVRWRDIRSGEASPEDRQRVEDAALDMMGKFPTLWVNDKPNSLATIETEVLRLEPDAIFVDHLRLLHDRDADEVIRLGRMSAGIKELAKQRNFAAIVLHQLSRGVEGRDEKRPILSDLRESGHIEENADSVWFLYREDYYDIRKRVQENVSKTELLIEKFRNDKAQQTVHLDFHLDRQWFERREALPILSENNTSPYYQNGRNGKNNGAPVLVESKQRELTSYERSLIDD